MSKNYLRKEYLGDASVLIPGGVKKVKISLKGIRGDLVSGAKLVTTSQVIDTTGTAWTWGRFTNGEGADNSVVPKSSPVQTVGNKNWLILSGGSDQFYGIDNAGIAWSCGSNTGFALGATIVGSRSSPILVNGNNRWRMLSGGRNGASGITTSGDIVGWGNNQSGQLGNNSSDPVGSSDPVVVVGNKKWRFVSRGNGYTLGIDDSYLLWSWGNNGSGQLGNGSMNIFSSPIQVLGNKTWIFCSAATDTSSAGVNGDGHCLAIDSDGFGWSWGSNVSGQLGLGDTTPRSSPVQIAGNMRWKKLSANTQFSAGIDENGILWTWGANSLSTLGDGTQTPKSSPVQVLGNKTWVDVAVLGQSFMLGLDSDGKLWGWGNNAGGQLGDGTVVQKSSPTAVLGNKIWNIQSEFQINDICIDVVPNQTYELSIHSDIITFGAIPLGYSMGMMPKVIMEYYQ